MVKSIRHWCEVAQFVEQSTAQDKDSRRHFQPTTIAQKLLLNDAWDPFLEDDASLWLIHWLIATNPSTGTSWQLVFSRFNRPDFTRREITNYIRDFTDKEGLRASESVIKRDVDCLIRTYVPAAKSKKKDIAEASFACPLLQLNLIQISPDGELYRFDIAPKPSLPTSVFAYALHKHFERKQNSTETMSIQECLYGEGSPGQVFKLDENSLIEYVEELEDTLEGMIMLDETAGLKQIYRRKDYAPLDILDSYYRGGHIE